MKNSLRISITESNLLKQMSWSKQHYDIKTKKVYIKIHYELGYKKKQLCLWEYYYYFLITIWEVLMVVWSLKILCRPCSSALFNLSIDMETMNLTVTSVWYSLYSLQHQNICKLLRKNPSHKAVDFYQGGGGELKMRKITEENLNSRIGVVKF